MNKALYNYFIKSAADAPVAAVEELAAAAPEAAAAEKAGLLDAIKGGWGKATGFMGEQYGNLKGMAGDQVGKLKALAKANPRTALLAALASGAAGGAGTMAAIDKMASIQEAASGTLLEKAASAVQALDEYEAAFDLYKYASAVEDDGVPGLGALLGAGAGAGLGGALTPNRLGDAIAGEKLLSASNPLIKMKNSEVLNSLLGKVSKGKLSMADSLGTTALRHLNGKGKAVGALTGALGLGTLGSLAD